MSDARAPNGINGLFQETRSRQGSAARAPGSPRLQARTRPALRTSWPEGPRRAPAGTSSTAETEARGSRQSHCRLGAAKPQGPRPARPRSQEEARVAEEETERAGGLGQASA